MLEKNFNLDLIQTPEGWERKKTHFGNLRLIKGEEQIDVWCLESNLQIGRPGHTKTIEEYLKTVPLTIQSIAYDSDLGKIFGDIGLESLLTKIVKINNLERSYKASSKRGHNIEYYLLMKSMKIGFIPDLSNLKEKTQEYFRKKKQYKYKQEEKQ
ncbi:MAG: hypothetical protein KKF46_00230 [Nanoarchaeota archaeon]|nr:hypothetical protein [Nanoarchaeota archaeon]MBU1320760.1 hypothetical protein [Nanoarchaeota archaeon]MBU1597642.1 hypothetical protein [Nanoarchaeota archaeon]MBU2442185.1 hypothetical protein [Nanoarchaeota archaeon]